MPNYHDNHYAKMKMQPIEVMQKCMSDAELGGLFIGQIIKYHMRAGHKSGESFDKDIEKRDRYISWLYQHAVLNEYIVPTMPSIDVPEEYKLNLLNNIEAIYKE